MKIRDYLLEVEYYLELYLNRDASNAVERHKDVNNAMAELIAALKKKDMPELAKCLDQMWEQVYGWEH